MSVTQWRAFSIARFDGPTGMDHRAGRIGRAHRHGDAEARCAPDLSVILRPISVMAGRFTPAPASAAIRAAKHQRTAPGVARIPPRGSCAGLPRGKGRKRHRSAIFVMLKPATAQNVAAPARTARPVRPDHPSGGPSRMPPERPVGEAAALPCAASGSRQGCGPGQGRNPVFAVPPRALAHRLAPTRHEPVVIGVSGLFHPKVTHERGGDRRRFPLRHMCSTMSQKGRSGAIRAQPGAGAKRINGLKIQEEVWKINHID